MYNSSKDRNQQKLLAFQLNILAKMNRQKQMIMQLIQYRVDVSRQSERSIQQKIIQMYDLLQQKTTQNLFLRKQNDDIKLQIGTINDLFANASVRLEECHMQNSFKSPRKNSPTLDQQQSHQLKKFQESSQKKKRINQGQSNYQRFQKVETPGKDYLEESQQSADSSVETEEKTPRYPSRPSQHSQFYQNIYDKQQTQRVIADKVNNEDKSMNEKIELLMKQNELILKRMNQIEVNFISKAQQQTSNQQQLKSIDDRSTNFSSNTLSINNMWNKKDSLSHDKKLTSHTRAHYSTSNLKTYCPRIE